MQLISRNALIFFWEGGCPDVQLLAQQPSGSKMPVKESGFRYFRRRVSNCRPLSLFAF
jgi:hypothetical protein